MGKNNTIRLNVGGRLDASTDVIRIWAHKDDVYFFYRSLSHKMHVSLHKSGVWKMDAKQDRFKLNPEVELVDGWGLGPDLIYPNIRVKRLDIDGNHLKDKRVIILDHAPIDQMRVVKFIFQRDTRAISIKKVIEDKLKLSVDWHKEIKLRTKGVLHIISYISVPDDTLLKYFYSVKNKIKINFKDEVPKKGLFSNLMLLETPKDTSRPSYILSIPTGVENYQLDK
jgi:hypothetical protein